MRTTPIQVSAHPAPPSAKIFPTPSSQDAAETSIRTVEVSVLVPAHNEEFTIQACLERAARALDERNIRFEIIVIDDGSTDATEARALSVARNDGGRIRVVRRTAKSGKGAALIAGARCARGVVAVVLDADMEYAPEEITPIIEPILEGRCDVVFGSRFTGKYDGMGVSHFVGNRILTRTTNLLYHGQLTDVMTGYKAFRLSALRSLEVDECGFGFEVELAAKALSAGLSILEVPISYHRRFAGKSKIRWTDGIRCLIQLLELKTANRES